MKNIHNGVASSLNILEIIFGVGTYHKSYILVWEVLKEKTI